MKLSKTLRDALLKSVLEQVAREADAEVSWGTEFRFHPTRKWRFDGYLTVTRSRVDEEKWAIEVDGGGWINGRHNRESGRVKEREKYNEAALLGWRVLCFNWKDVEDGTALRTLRRALGA